MPRIELIYFTGCPHVEAARQNISAAVDQARVRPSEFVEWDLLAESTPDALRLYASPTVLIDGRDVVGDSAQGVAIACRAEGAPSIQLIASKLIEAQARQ